MTSGTAAKALGAAVVCLLALAGCGAGGGSGSETTTKSHACQKAHADIEKVTNYDAKTNPSPTISPETAKTVSRIIVDNPSCFDAELVAQARGSLGLPTSTETTSTSGPGTP